MTVTVEQVVLLAELDLRLATHTPSLDRPLRWVAVSEQQDPTPWIESGDLVLTTGMAMSSDASECRAYVERLVRADAAGLGFGVGLHHAQVPAALVAAGEELGLPVIIVPEPLPFVAVSRAVSRLLSAEEYAESGASFDSQRKMIRAVLAASASGDSDSTWAEAVVATLAKHVGGFALHLSPTGAVVNAAPASAVDQAADLQGEVDRLRPRGLLASASVVTGGQHTVLVPVGIRETVRGFLVIGSPRRLTSADQAVVNLGVSLLSWGTNSAAARDGAGGRWHALLIEHASVDGLSSAGLKDLGFGRLDPRRAVAVVARAQDPKVSVPEYAGDGDVVLAADDSGVLVGLVAVDEGGRLPDSIRTWGSTSAFRAVGVSEVTDLTDPINVRQAIAQAREASTSGTGWCMFGDLRTRSIDSLIDGSLSRAWAESYLRPFSAVDEGAELKTTLRAWLAHHGQVDATAQDLGIHRHTVRHRLRRAEAALGASLDDPSVRADLWFALRSLG